MAADEPRGERVAGGLVREEERADRPELGVVPTGKGRCSSTVACAMSLSFSSPGSYSATPPSRSTVSSIAVIRAVVVAGP